MILSSSAAVLATLPGAPTLTVLAETGSTNDDLRVNAAGSPSFTTIVTGSQTGGRGRLGRAWVAPAGESLAMSVLLRPQDAAGRPLPVESYGWLPLIAGVAMTTAVRSLLPGRDVSLKWPNDVLIGADAPGGAPSGARKVCGILTELLADDRAVIVGAGLNLAIPADRLPTPTSTSLAIEGASGEGLADAACAAWLGELAHLVSAFGRARGDAEGSGIRTAVSAALGTLGRRVMVTIPGADPLVGQAVDLDGSGRIVVRPDGEVGVRAVAAGDVEHLRYE